MYVKIEDENNLLQVRGAPPLTLQRESVKSKLADLQPPEEEGAAGPHRRDALTTLNFAAYSVGHVFNDLCATAWFSYLLYFLTEVVNLVEADAGYARAHSPLP